MAFETKPNSGSMFKNDQKEQDTHADYRGSALIDGVDYWMDAWIKTAESGRKWMSFSFKPKQRAAAAPAPVAPKRQSSRFEDSDENSPPF